MMWIYPILFQRTHPIFRILMVLGLVLLLGAAPRMMDAAEETTASESHAPAVTVSRSPLLVVSGEAFSYQIAATNAPVSYSATGLPAGLALDEQTGAIRGVCRAPAGTLARVVVRAANAAGATEAVLALRIGAVEPLGQL